MYAFGAGIYRMKDIGNRQVIIIVRMEVKMHFRKLITNKFQKLLYFIRTEQPQGIRKHNSFDRLLGEKFDH